MTRYHQTQGFMLFETILAVVLLALAVIGLSKAFGELLEIQQIRVEQSGSRQVLDEIVYQIQSSTATPPESASMSYAEWWKSAAPSTAIPPSERMAGMQVEIKTRIMKLKTSKGQEVPGLFLVEVVVEDPTTESAESLNFVLSR